MSINAWPRLTGARVATIHKCTPPGRTSHSHRKLCLVLSPGAGLVVLNPRSDAMRLRACSEVVSVLRGEEGSWPGLRGELRRVPISSESGAPVLSPVDFAFRGYVICKENGQHKRGADCTECWRFAGIKVVLGNAMVQCRWWPALTSVSTVMRALEQVPIVAPQASCDDTLALCHRSGSDYALVARDGSLQGLVGYQQLRTSSGGTPVWQCMRRPVMAISPGESVAQALHNMEQQAVDVMLIVDHGDVRGLVTRPDIQRLGSAPLP